jgi:ATP-binding cassette subfamily B protein
MKRSRGRGPATVTAAEKAQAREVSLRRIGRLFRPYRWQLAIVTAIIVASSLVGLASPFLLRAVIDTALPDRNVRLLAWLVIGMVAVAAITSAFGVVQTYCTTVSRCYSAGHERITEAGVRREAVARRRVGYGHRQARRR